MSGLVPGTMALTAVFTALALLVTASHVGSGFLLYLAMLGGAAVWLLPVHVGLALPAAVFGATMLAASGPRALADRPVARDVVVLTCFLTLLCVYLVGWVMPAGHAGTGARVARYQNAPVERPEAEPPAALQLPHLLADGSEAARAELYRRLWPVAACLITGLAAAAFVASPLSWSATAALGGTAVVFILVMRHLLQMLEQ